MISVLITLTVVGADTGPTFDLFSDVDGYLSAFETGIVLTVGVPYLCNNTVPNGTTIIKIVAHNGVCQHTLSLSITTTTTSTSTSTTTAIPATTTTSTTVYPGPFTYYDVNTYTCNGEECAIAGLTAKIANHPVGATVDIGKFYTLVYEELIYIVEIVQLSVLQEAPGFITTFDGTGADTCAEFCVGQTTTTTTTIPPSTTTTTTLPM